MPVSILVILQDHRPTGLLLIHTLWAHCSG